jgi:hypothetical protein
MTGPEQSEKKHYFDDPEKVRKFVRRFIVCCVVLFLLDVIFLVAHKHLSFENKETHENIFPVEGWFGFYGVYGFVACVLLVLIAKQMRKVLMRREDYYDR